MLPLMTRATGWAYREVDDSIHYHKVVGHRTAGPRSERLTGDHIVGTGLPVASLLTEDGQG